MYTAQTPPPTRRSHSSIVSKTSLTETDSDVSKSRPSSPASTSASPIEGVCDSSTRTWQPTEFDLVADKALEDPASPHDRFHLLLKDVERAATTGSDPRPMHGRLASWLGLADSTPRPSRLDETIYNLIEYSSNSDLGCQPGIGPFSTEALVDAMGQIASKIQFTGGTADDTALLRQIVEMLPVAVEAQCRRGDDALNALFRPAQKAALHTTSTPVEPAAAVAAAATPPAPHDDAGQSIFLSCEEHGQLVEAIRTGHYQDAASLAGLMISITSRVLCMILQQKYPDQYFKIGGYIAAPDNLFSFIPRRDITQTFKQHEPYIMDGAHAAVLRVFNDPAIRELTSWDPEKFRALDEALTRSFAMSASLSGICNDALHGACFGTYKKFLLSQPVSETDFTEIISQSTINRQANNARIGASTMQEEVERFIEFYLFARTLLLSRDSRIALGKSLASLITDIRKEYVCAICTLKKIDPAIRRQMLDAVPNYVNTAFSFLLDPDTAAIDSTAQPAAVPVRPTAPTATTVPAVAPPATEGSITRFYLRLIDAVETRAEITEPDDSKYVSGGQQLQWSNALLIVMTAEKSAFKAGTPFDRLAFANNSHQPDVTAARAYLADAFSGNAHV